MSLLISTGMSKTLYGENPVLLTLKVAKFDLSACLPGKHTALITVNEFFFLTQGSLLP